MGRGGSADVTTDRMNKRCGVPRLPPHNLIMAAPIPLVLVTLLALFLLKKITGVFLSKF
jgi:hypothetical protein